MTEPRDRSDPARLSGGPLGDLLDAARADLPSERRMRDLAARLGPLLDPPPDGSGGTGGAPPSAGETSPPAAPRSAALGPLAVVAGLVAATGLVAILARSPSTGERSQHADAARSATAAVADPPLASAEVIGAAEPAEAPVVPSATSSARDGRPARPVPRAGPSAASAASASSASVPEPAAAASTPPEPPETEASLLGRAQAAVASSPARALALAEEHARTFPRGALAQEREVIQVAALVRLGRVAEARARAAAFASRFPRSAHVRRMEALVPGATAPSAESTSRADSDQKR